MRCPKLLAVLAASTIADSDSDIDVTLQATDANVEAGSSVNLTCGWELNADYTDYDEDNFEMFWKVLHKDEYGEPVTQSILKYRPGSAPMQYYDTILEGRVKLYPDFEDQRAIMEVGDLRISDDEMRIQCEVHWGRRFEVDEEELDVYVDAADVDLEELQSSLDGRVRDDGNGTIIQPEDEEVAYCSVKGVYPLPDTVVFLVGEDEIEVDAGLDSENADGTFDVSGTLVLFPSGKYDGDEVTCVSVAAPGADEQVAMTEDANGTVTDAAFNLEVLYTTDDVDLEIKNANMIDDDEYSVNEGNVFTVSCSANGNPPPQIRIMNGDEEIDNDQSITAVRDLADNMMDIRCEASNNDNVDIATEDVTVEVYYIDDVEVGDDEVKMYDENFSKECRVEGHPTPKIQWTKGDSDQVIDDGDLELGALTYEEAGKYTCTGTNAAGSESDSFELTVNGPCLVQISSANAGQSAEFAGQAALTLKCEVKGTDCQIDWTSDQEGLIAKGRTEFVNGVSTLWFDSIDKFIDETQFTCKGTNTEGVEEDTITINDTHQPVCCAEAPTASMGTGAIVGIVIAIPALLIIIGAAVFFCRKRSDDKNVVDEGDDANEASEKQPLQAEHDGEGTNAGDKV